MEERPRSLGRNGHSGGWSEEAGERVPATALKAPGPPSGAGPRTLALLLALLGAWRWSPKEPLSRLPPRPGAASLLRSMESYQRP